MIFYMSNICGASDFHAHFSYVKTIDFDAKKFFHKYYIFYFPWFIMNAMKMLMKSLFAFEFFVTNLTFVCFHSFIRRCNVMHLIVRIFHICYFYSTCCTSPLDEIQELSCIVLICLPNLYFWLWALKILKFLEQHCV